MTHLVVRPNGMMWLSPRPREWSFAIPPECDADAILAKACDPRSRLREMAVEVASYLELVRDMEGFLVDPIVDGEREIEALMRTLR
jgi:hypothetical protein